MEWKEVRLGDICEIKGGKRLPKGVSLVTQRNEHPYIRIRDLGNKKVIELDDSYEYVDDETQKSISRYVVSENDILLSIVGTIGLVAKVGVTLHNANLTENCVKLINLQNINSDFLYYFLSSQSGQEKIKQGTVGAVQPKLPIKNIQDIVVTLPTSVEDQKRIADILSSLDAKIENNNKINAKLEEMAQALFKSWFIDFEPFKVGRDGSRPAFGSGTFVESELGMIPEGWKVGCYNDIIEGTVSGDWGKESPIANYTHHVACVRGCDFQDIKNGVRGKTPERYILEKNYQNKKLQHHDILVEISGGTATVSTGRICLVTDTLIDKYDKDIVCTNFCRVARPKEGYSAYIFYSWQWKYNNRVMFGYENGTSGIKNFQMTGFLDKELLIIPPKDAIAKFQTIIDDLYKKIQINGSEITKLVQTRDTLLPKLMSGEIEL